MAKSSGGGGKDTKPVNRPSFRPTKSGSVRLEGQIASGDGSTSRGATARAGTLASSSGGEGEGRVHHYPSYQSGGMGLNKFRPTTKGGKVRGG